ncbi:MAG: transposase [Deltaproteobacteria bacterium]|nr:transposase [Deltaproteobacteria bacterium]
MARPRRIQFDGALYHVVVQVARRKPLFHDSRDKQRYLKLLLRYRNLFGYKLYAYRVTSSCVHLLLETPRGNISKVMQCLGTSYSLYFNRRHRRKGALFQSRYRSCLIDKERYLPELTRYIHRSPLRAGVGSGQKRANSWSSYPVYLGQELSDLVETRPVLARFGRKLSDQRKSYRRFVEKANAVYPAEGSLGRIIGSKHFVARAMASDGGPASNRDGKGLSVRKAERILREISLALTPFSDFERLKGQRSLARHLTMYLIRSQTSLSLRSIGEMLGVKAPAVALAIKKIERLLKERDVSNNVERLLKINGDFLLNRREPKTCGRGGDPPIAATAGGIKSGL